jgi:hypothetical protein
VNNSHRALATGQKCLGRRLVNQLLAQVVQALVVESLIHKVALLLKVEVVALVT